METQQLPNEESEFAPRALLHVRELAMAFDGQQVLKNIDIDLHEGQVVLLRGANGSGKTTLVNILTGFLCPDEGEIRLYTNGTEEKFTFPRYWWQDLNPWDHFLPERVAQKGISRSWQETRLFHSIRLIDNIAVSDSKNPAENLFNILFRPGYSQQAEMLTNTRANDTLGRVGLKSRSQSSADKVSLGQAKRIALARAIGTGAQVLFLDEPLAGLDKKGIVTMVNLLQELVKQHKIAIVLVEHVSTVHHLLPVVDTIWDLENGKVRETYVGNEVPVNGKGTEAHIGLRQLIRNLKVIKNVNLPGGATLDIYRKKTQDRTNNSSVLQLDNIVVHRSRRLVIGVNKDGDGVDGINLTVSAGELALLRAPNGWGKSTLLDSVAGLQPHTTGKISFCGKNISKRPSWERQRLGMHYLRSAFNFFPTLGVSEFFRLNTDKSNCISTFENNQLCGELSGGEKQRINIQYLQQRDVRLLLLDEPLAALDEDALKSFVDWISTLLQSMRCAIVIAVPS